MYENPLQPCDYNSHEQNIVIVRANDFRELFLLGPTGRLQLSGKHYFQALTLYILNGPNSRVAAEHVCREP